MLLFSDSKTGILERENITSLTSRYVTIPIFLLMCYLAGIPLRFLMLFFATGMLTVIITVLPIWESEIVQKDVTLVNLITEPKLRLFLIAVSSCRCI